MENNLPCVTLITPTGDRPESLARCIKFLARFDASGIEKVQWILIDDGQRAFTGAILTSSKFEFVYTRPETLWSAAKPNTLASNLWIGLQQAKHEIIIFIEDDDWYAPNYLQQQVERLANSDIAGEIPARYYHVPSSQYRIFENRYHASLCQTAIRRSLLPMLEKICLAPSPDFIDVRLWRESASARQHLSSGQVVIRLKGLPGRPGIGVGHRPGHNGAAKDGWRADPDSAVFKKWLGADAELYGQYKIE